MSKTETCFYRSLALLLSENKREKKKLRPCGGGQDNTPSEGGGGVRLLESFLCRVPFGSTESFSYLCCVNLKAVTLWQHSITQQEN